jgi:hypothetical protein
MSINEENRAGLVKLAQASGSIVLDGNDYAIKDLIEITRALETGCTSTILNAGGKNTIDLLSLVAEAPKQLISS